MNSLHEDTTKRPKIEPIKIVEIIKDFMPGLIDEADIEYSQDDPVINESSSETINSGSDVGSADSNKALTSSPSTFDLNIAEFPMTHLSNRLPSGVSKTEIRYSDFINGKDGARVQRSWTVTSNAKIDVLDKNGEKVGEDIVGLGGPTALQVFFEILQIWKEQGLKSNMIFIGTYYNLLKRLGWSNGGKSYQQLIRDLNSLYGLEFNAKNAYYDKTENRYVDRKMKLFEGWTLHKISSSEEAASDYGYIHATNMFWDSMRNRTNFFLPFNKDYFKKLTPQEAKLSLYLSKVFNPYRKRIVHKYKRNIFDLCNILPIIATEKRRQKYLLLKAAQGLLDKEFNLLAEYYVENDIIIFINKQSISRIHELRSGSGAKSKDQIEMLVDEQLRICGDKHSTKFYEIIAKYCPDVLIYKCLAEAKVEGKDVAKYYNFQIKLQGKEYLKDVIFHTKDEVIQESLHLKST